VAGTLLLAVGGWDYRFCLGMQMLFHCQRERKTRVGYFDQGLFERRWQYWGATIMTSF
jgi:hypothetical protein